MRLKTLLFLTSAVLGSMLIASCSTPAATAPVKVSQPTTPPVFASATLGCSVVNTEPTPSSSSLLPPITASDYARGPESAAVTLLYYCDFESFECEQLNRVLDPLAKEHPDDLRVVMRPVPIPPGSVPTAVPPSPGPYIDKSEISAAAALAAGNQGKFWQMRDLLHSQYAAWVLLPPSSFDTWISAQAAGLGLDATKFRHDLESSTTQSQVKSLYASAVALGITAIPTVFINGSLIPKPALRYEGLDSTISVIALGAHQFRTCPPFSVDPSKHYTATLHTEKGDIVIQLYADKAPLAVNSFIFLARQGWFDGVTFHRVIPGFVAQTGDPSGTGQGGPGYFFNNEINADLNFDKPGVVGMANSGPNTNGSQFFITYSAQPQLDGGYTVFGQVIDGMQVVESLTPRDPQQTPDLPPGDKILNVTIQEQ